MTLCGGELANLQPFLRVHRNCAVEYQQVSLAFIQPCYLAQDTFDPISLEGMRLIRTFRKNGSQLLVFRGIKTSKILHNHPARILSHWNCEHWFQVLIIFIKQSS